MRISQITLLSCVALFASCATILNSSRQEIVVYSKKPVKYIVNKEDTISPKDNRATIVVERKNPLTITAISDTAVHTFYPRSRTSGLFWMNLFTPYFVGIPVDLISGKAKGYKRFMYLDQSGSNMQYSNFDSLSEPHSMLLKFSPLKLMGLFHPGVELGLEFPFSQKNSMQILASYLFPISSAYGSTNWDPTSSRWNVKNQKFNISFEARHYLTRGFGEGLYLGLDMNHLNSKTVETVPFYDEDPNALSQDTYQDSISVHKIGNSMAFKLGYVIPGDRVSLDMYIGLGVRYVNTTHEGRQFPEHTLKPALWAIGNHGNLREGKYTQVILPLGVRLSIRL
ncbi:MAG: hypothetical protein ACJAY8_000263 [Sphingobacteriales bacterium]|jgi:hypothetical protein